MYLRALEIQGFKSFAGKTRLTFEKPVTAIVGPNGSGKSNISDAVRWVMGEQSTRALRGGKMEDVIFGGTEKRGPVGFAEVSLILDNTSHVFDMESSEVMVTRRYYRSGESEYYINRQSCRLKDINELFMDTGLGREGYSIIGQGRIDEILSVKSTERREIFEEAAGISRFRHRKEESESKLERSQENMVRISDKIAELELQVEPLRRQSETAKKYLVLRDELRGLEISVWTDSLEKLGGSARKLEEDCAAAERHLSAARTELEALYQEGESFSARMQEKDAQAEQVRQEISREEAASAEAESSMAVLQANLKNNEAGIARIGSEMDRQGGQEDSLLQQIRERESRMAEIDRRRGELSGEREELLRSAAAAEESAGQAEEEISALAGRENQLKTEMAAEKSALSARASAIQEQEDRSAAIISEKSAAEERLEETRTAAGDNEKELAKARENRDAAANVIRGYQLRVNSRTSRAAEAGEKRIRLTMEENAVRSRLNLLTEMEKEYQGFTRAVKLVMQEAKNGGLRGIFGPAANLLKTDNEYALAVETAMGGAMQDILVENEEAGKAAIGMLKRRDGGRATFMPVSTIRGSRLNERLDGEPGFVGVAVDLVRFDPRFAGVFTYLLGRIAVAENLDCAIRMGRRFGSRFKIVTLDGQVIHAGGSMTGGSTAKSAGILSRANEIKNLSGQLAGLTERLAGAAEAEENAKREKAAAEYELGVASEEMRGHEDAVLKLEAAAGHYTLLLQTLEDSFRQLEREAAGVKEKIAAGEEKVRQSRARLTAAEKELETVRARLEEKTSGSRDLAARRAALSAGLSENSAADASLLAERQTLQQGVQELEALRQDISGGRQKQLSDMEALRAENREIQQEIARRESDAEEIRRRIGALRQRITAITEEKLQLEARRSRHNRETQDKNNELLNMQQESARLEQRKAAAEMEEKQILDRLWDTYELSRSEAMVARQPLEDLRAASRRIGELKREIGKLGSPNIGAIEEFERVNSRYTYLTEQRDDVARASAELEKIIRDITAEMKEIFAREFENIRRGFKETFTDMFGGGRADLELEDPENILDCGIEIRVQPPGKSLKTITLLSGGEKAFVAIALYFAILKVRPTPFVIMDEIEAALDEANVVRFAEYLRKLTEKTQFLLITHRRGTMEEADVLYGVTMQEQGVSQVITVDLAEAEKTLGK